MSNKVINGLAVAIIVVWVVTCVGTLINPAYTPPASVQWTISILAGAAFGKAAAAVTKVGQDK